MKKYLILTFLFLLTVTPAIAKSSNATSQPNQTNNPSPVTTKNATVTSTSTSTSTVTTTGTQVKNQNQTQTKNEGEDQQLSVQTQESEQLNQEINQNFQKVSDQVHQLIDTVGAKTGIGQQVKDIAQNQTKLQDDIKTNVSQLASRSALTKFFIGSDKKTLQNMEQQMEQNRLMIQQLEEVTTQTTNSGDIDQIQQTIDLLIYQNATLQEKISNDNKVNGLFGW